MEGELIKSIIISASGLRVQGERMRVIAENLANANSIPQQPGAEPYRRKVLTFRNQLDRALGVDVVRVGGRDTDRSEFPKRRDPGHPAADENGYVRLPNVNSLVEMMDMREAQRSYEANLVVIESAKGMLTRPIDICADRAVAAFRYTT